MGATNTNSGGPMRQQQQQQQISTTASRGASQPREMSFPVSLSYAVQPAQQQQKQVVQPSSTQVQGTSFIVDSSTPPPHLEAQAAGVAQQTQQPAQSPAPTLSVYSYQYLHLPNGKWVKNCRNNKAKKNCASFLSKCFIFISTTRRRNSTFSAASVHFYYFGTAAKLCRTSRQYASTRSTRHDLFAPILCGSNRRSTSWFSSRYAKRFVIC